jgi:glucose-1-phosphate adenylyltransferase
MYSANQLARSTVALILAGGRGERLQQLTDWRAKPAVPFGGKFRIIDFALSNCVNSGIRRIGICTQYRAQSLIRHVQRGWSFLDGRFNEFVELLPAQQRVSADWYRGTADAVYQNLDVLRQHAPARVLVLAGDHVYKMDYGKMLDQHVARSARVTLGCVEVPVADAVSFGVVQVNERGLVSGFEEKPAQPTPLVDRPHIALASMGIYLFDRSFLEELLRADARDPASGHDFGKDILPRLVKQGGTVYAHLFSESCVNMTRGLPYWRDVGTLDAYWEANIDLTHVIPDLNMYDQAWPIWTYQEQLPPAKFVFDDDKRRGQALDSLVSGGCIVSGSRVKRSLLFSNVHVHSYCDIEDCVILPGVDVGRGVVLKRVVVDGHCALPPGLIAGVDPVDDARRFHISAKGVTLITAEMLGQQVPPKV